MTYWFDARSCSAFCLVDAPNAEAAIRVHQESHGLAPVDIIEVDPAVVEAFLGRLADPVGVAHGHAPIEEAARRTLMFTDIVNSTEMTARLGDKRAVELVRAHDGIVRRALLTRGGREIKHTGDGIMAAFADADEAVRAACAIQRGVAEFNAASADALHVRIGMHTGEPVSDNSDLFGATVQMAARICEDAAVDAVVISEDLRALLCAEVSVTPLGRRMLKGFADPAPLYAVDWR